MERELDVLFINQHYGEEAPATGVLLKQLAENLAASGYRIGVLTSFENGAKKSGLIRTSQESGVRITRVRAISSGSKSIPRRLSHYASFFTLALLAGLRIPAPTRVVTMSTPPMLALLLGKFLGNYHQAPVFYNVQDLYPDVALATGKLPNLLQRPSYAIAKALEKRLAGISTVGVRMQKTMRARSRRTIVHVPNWADHHEIKPLTPENSLRKEWGLEGKFIVQYAGNIGLCHDVALIAEVIELLRNQPIDFLFVGSGAGRPLLERLLPHDCRVHFRPFEPRKNINRVLACADVGWVNLGRGMSRYLVPSKAFGILAAGKPLLGVSDLHDDIYRLLRDSKAGMWAPAGDASAVARTILHLHGKHEELTLLGQNARRFAESQSNLQHATESWRTWLKLEAPAIKAGVQIETAA